jgi:hypothetical protein
VCNFSESAWRAMPCYYSPQKVIIAFGKTLFVLGADKYLEKLEGKIRKC